MKFATSMLCLAVALTSVSARPMKRDVNPDLVPQFGVTAGVDPDGHGNCAGIPGSNGQPILVPCSCPPPRDQFIADLNANVNAGFAVNNTGVKVSFPTDDSNQSAAARIEAAIITLQNTHGPGVGCPASSTTFVAQQQAAAAGLPPPPPLSAPSSSSAAETSSAAAAASKTSAAATSSDCESIPTVTVTVTVVSTSTPAATSPAQAAAPPPPVVTSATSTSTSTSASPSVSLVDASLVPEFGVTAGIHDPNSASCQGIDGANGQPALIPCDCPPDRDAFIQELSQNVAVGFVINNPSVHLSFPTDDSKASKLARLNAASDTLQNISGPGKGCPIVSTTFQAQAAAINAEPGP